MEMLSSFTSRTLAPAHTAKTTSKCFADHDITVLDWPSWLTHRVVSWVPCSTLSTHMTACPLTAPLLLSKLLMIMWFWASFPTMMRPYLDEVERITSWCQDNCLSLNVSKTKELIVDFRKRHLQPYTPLMISGTTVERVSSFKYLGVNISEDLTWTTHAVKIIKDSNHPGNCLFTLLPSGKRFHSLMAKTERIRSFFPQAIRLLNSNSAS